MGHGSPVYLPVFKLFPLSVISCFWLCTMCSQLLSGSSSSSLAARVSIKCQANLKQIVAGQATSHVDVEADRGQR